MDNYNLIYWLTRLDSLNGLLGIIFGVSTLYLVATLIYKTIQEEFWDDDQKAKYNKAIKSWRRAAFISIIICSLGLTFIPTRNEAILIIAGGKTIDYMQQDTSLSKISHQIPAMVSEYLDKQIKDIREKK